jgi:hypothetical protein
LCSWIDTCSWERGLFSCVFLEDLLCEGNHPFFIFHFVDELGLIFWRVGVKDSAFDCSWCVDFFFTAFLKQFGCLLGVLVGGWILVFVLFE